VDQNVDQTNRRAAEPIIINECRVKVDGWRLQPRESGKANFSGNLSAASRQKLENK